MRLLIIGALEGQLSEATKLAMDSGARVAHAPTIDIALNSLRLGKGADLLVMGAYGNKRWWEMLFGGVTRTVLDSMTALTLLSR